MKLYTVFSTFPDIETAREVSRVLVEKRLVACVNLIPAVESIYQWEGKLCQENEVMAMMKTHHDRLIDLEKTLVELHPYDVPEMIALEIKEGHTPYLDWVGSA